MAKQRNYQTKSPEQKKKEFDDLKEKLFQGIQDLNRPENIAQFLVFKSRFYNYSLNNQMLIYLQLIERSEQLGIPFNPHLVYAKSYTDWVKEIGTKYPINKGEHGLKIISSFTTRYVIVNDVAVFEKNWTDEIKRLVTEEKIKVSPKRDYMVGTTFNIDQTKAEELGYKIPNQIPRNILSSNYEKELTDLCCYINTSGKFNYEVKFYHDVSTTKGYTEGNAIYLNRYYKPDANFSTLFHEMGHCEMKHNDEQRAFLIEHFGTTDNLKSSDFTKEVWKKIETLRMKFEFQAESYSFCMKNILGLPAEFDNASYRYINSWVRISKEEKMLFMNQSFQKVDECLNKTSNTIIDFFKNQKEMIPIGFKIK